MHFDSSGGEGEIAKGIESHRMAPIYEVAEPKRRDFIHKDRLRHHHAWHGDKRRGAQISGNGPQPQHVRKGIEGWVALAQSLQRDSNTLIAVGKVVVTTSNENTHEEEPYIFSKSVILNITVMAVKLNTDIFRARELKASG